MKLTKKLEAEVLKVYKAYWDAYLSGDFKTFASMLDDNITVFGTASSEVFTDKKETVRFYKATAGQLVGKAQFRNRKINLNQVDTNILVNEQCDLYLLMDRKWIFYGHVRVSAILKQTKTGWKLIHQHASFPDIRAEEGEQVAMEKIQAENLLLRDAVKRRTIELEEKNSELEIESALEKVRTVAMAMKTPDDMLKVCSVINQQLKQLGTRDIRNIQTAIFNTSDNSYLNYEYFPVKDKSIITRIDYRLQPDVRAFAKKMMKAPGTFYTKSFKGAELKKWNQYQEKTNQFIDPGQYKASGLHYYFYSIGMGALGISVFTPLSKEEIVIFKRFHNVFELAYKRFVDIQKAEAQTREAQIEVAVERVRAKALAMHKSEDVYDVLRMLRNALFGLNLQGITGVTICLKEDSENVRLCDITDIDQNGRYGWDITFKINEIDPRLWVSQIWRSKKEIIAFEQDSDDLKRALKWLGQYDKKMADQITELIKVNKIKHGWHRAVRLANGMLITDFTNKPPAETEPILLKMGAAFDLAYKRFLDLKNAEAQAREAQIEAALEKIRSRSLAMHHSRELKEVIAVLFEKLNELNVLLGTVAIQLFDHASMNSFLWVGNAIQDPQMVNMPYDKKMMLENTYVKDGWEAMREGRDIINKEYSLKEKNKFFKYAFANNDLTQIPESAREVLRKIKKHIVCLFTEKNSALFVDSFDGQHFSKENLAIIKRAGKVFEQCYIRFLDLQKAEAQAREGQIQLALERVRARTMAMHHSDELADVVKLLYQEFDKLKINNESTDIEIGLIDEETGIASIWAHFYLSDGTISTFQFPTTHFDEVREEVEKWKTVPLKKRNELFFTTEFSQERLKKFMEIADQLPGLAEIFRPLIEAKITKWVTHNAYFSHGFLTLQGTEAYSPETQEIQKRFAKVFEQTYTRFLDLKKAEAQAREAQIEASLERVRAKTIAMHKSSDQLGVVKVLGEQLELLGVKFDSVNFNTDYLEKDWNLWLYNSGVPMYPDKLHIPYLDHPCFNRPIEAYKEGADLQSFVFTKEEKDSLFDHIYTYSIARMAPEERKRYTYAAPGLVWSVAYGKHTAVTISNYRAEPFSDEENAILKRFANVFEQSYTRFLDLQKAEAQAREAEIELALERVRARTMAMQKPTEFNEVINVIGEQFLHLGFDLQWATFSAKGLDIANGLDLWIFAVIPGLFRSADRLFIPRAHHPIFTAYEQALNDYQTTGKDFFVMTFDKTDKDSWLDHLHKTTTYKDLPPELLALDYDKPGYTNSVVILKDTWLSIGKHDSVPFKDEENAILKRFSVAFGQAYTRFLDLQKAEAQAREAEIELALERVRARTMAMQKSDELRETVLVIYEQLKLLHFDSRACNIIIIDKESGSARYWVSGFSQEIFPVSYMVPYLNHPYHDALLKPWKQGDKYVVYEYTGKLKQSFDKIFFTQTEFRNIPDEAKNVMTGLKSVILSTAYTTYGAIQSLGTEPLSDENASVLQRFAKVFEQTYTRFLDLQKAEAQAREAQVEVALERVRSKAMAMHKTEDLPSAVSLLFDELDKLEPGMLRCGIGILHREKRTADVWTTARSETGTNIQTSGDEPMDIHPLLQGDFDAWLRQEEFSYTLEGKDLENYYQVLTETNFQLPESASFDTIKKDHKQYYYVTPFELGTIFAFREEEFTTEARMVMKRFANVFNLTYKRFLDLQKAESQAREAQIEAALERVRSRTMGMQKSEELKEVIRVVYEQFVQLNIHVEHAGFIIDYKQRDDMHIWLADQHEVPFQVTIPYFDCAHWNSFIDAKQKGKDFFANHLGFEEKNKFYKALFDLFPVPDEAKEYYFNCPGLAISTVLLENVGLYIENFSGIPYTDEENNILMRFGKVFQQTYTRFLDLQKAEAQAREAKIETALEKVRARTMGMQRSGELPQAASLLFQQIQSLGMPTWSAGYCLWDDDKNAITLWMSSEGVIQPALRMPLTEDPSLMHFREAYERGESFWVEAVGGEELKSHYAYLRTLPGLKETLDDIETAGFPVPTFQIFHLAYFSKGFLLFITYEPVPEAHDIFKRFANVFEQTYTRFLDLQKAEAQAREARIEAALERVRSRSMGMQKSDELAEVVAVLYKQFESLDFGLYQVLVSIYDKKNNVIEWWSRGFGAIELPQRNIIPIIDHPFPNDLLEKWENGVEYYPHLLEGEMKNSWETYLFTKTDLKNFPQEIKDAMRSIDKVYLSDVFMKYGSLQAAGPAPLPGDKAEILKRFVKVLDLAYTRMKDLQTAEMQAREAQIELGLERVRSRAMAMQSSEELNELIETVFTELTKLDLVLTRCVILIYEGNEKGVRWWMANSEAPSMPMNFFVKYADLPFFNEYLQGWQTRSLKWQYKLEGENKVKTDDFLFNETELSRLPEFIIAGMRARDTVYLNASFNNFGNLTLATLEPLSDEHFDILLRFAKVFDLTYTRFNDLKQAEAQARESQIQLALERVRARTMAMQRSEEFMETAVVLFDQLRKLGENIERTIIGVINEEEGVVNVWATRPDGSQMDNMQKFPLDEPILMQKVYTAWRQHKKSIVIDLRGEELESYFQFLKGRSSRLKRENFGDRRVENFAFFSKGILGVINANPNTPADVELYERFAAVFEQTYTRFLDLQKAEAQTREAQIEAALERVRSRAMAMHKTDELLDAAELIYRELTALGIASMNVSYAFVDEKERYGSYYSVNPVDGKTVPFPFVFPHTETEVMRSLLSSWKKQEPFNVTELDEKATLQHQTYIGEQIQKQLAENNPEIPFSIKAFLEVSPKNAVIYNFNFAQGYIFIIGSSRLTTEQEQIVLRFTKVFELTYRRFLDLTQAEAQAREAKIETALERVRSRTMAMHKSEELSEAAFVLFQQFKELGEEPERIFIATFDEIHDGVIDLWGTNEGGKQLDKLFQVPADEPTMVSKIIAAWKEGKKSTVVDLRGEELGRYLQFLKSAGIPFAEGVMSDRRVQTVACFSKGVIGITTHEPRPAESVELLERFAGVFNLTYTRFLDLQKAEAQAKEARIQLALERVRARTMAMQKSNELAEAAQLLYEEFRTLGINTYLCGYLFFKEEQHKQTAWVTAPDGILIPDFVDFPLEGDPVLDKRYQDWKQKKPLHVLELQGEANKEHHRFLASKVADPTANEIFSQMPPRIIFYCANFSAGCLFIIATEFLTQEEEDTIVRFAKVFELTYTRFNDLKQAEAQANEARIEISLERIRARALAMHKSDELKEVAKVLWEQMALLGQRELEASVVHLYEEDPGHILSWRAVSIGTDSSNKLTFGHMAIPKNSCEVVREWQAKFYSDLKEYTIDISGAKQAEWYELLFKLAPDVVNSMRQKNSIHEKRYYRFSKFSGGALLMVSTQAPSEEVAYLQRRAAAVFDLAYRRFSDLQKAEAQARESEIELALERVRAKSMSMRHSDELADLVRILFKELNSIGFSINGCIIMTYDERTNDSTWWIANSDGVSTPVGLLVPNHPHAPYQAYLKEWKKQTPKWSYRLGGAEKKEWDQYVFTNSGLAALPDPVKTGMQSVKDVQLNVCFNKYASITFGSVEPMGDKDFDTLHRFAKVFEQSYTRFLDLQNAEAQTREAKIEAALERVRAKAMAMHKSEDLHEAVKIMFEEFQKLNLDVLRCGVGILNKNSRTGSVWATSVSDDGLAVQISADESFETHPLMMLIYEYWQKQEDLEYILQGQDLMNYYRAMKESDLKLPESQLTFSEDELQPQYYYGAMFRSGGLYAFREKPFAEEDKKIMKRFASVVNLTYNRFLDLQKAEASAREAQIEAGLERVRATTMAMHNSDDVSAATATMFAELEKLGIQNLRGGITIIKQDQTQEVWSITNLPDGSTIRSIGVFDMRLHPFWQAIFEAKERKEDYMYYWMAGKDKENYIAILNATPNYLDQPIKEIPDVHVQCYFFGEGGVWTNSLQPHSEEDKQIMKRFASVFSLTFRRYQDLKKAEAQAREATIEAALEKVRGKAMAMHNSNDLSVTTSIIISELKKLGIKPIRCGVGIINKETHKAQLYTARFSPDGDSLSVVGWVLLKGHPVLETIYEKWVHGEDYYPELSGDSRKAYYERLLAGLSIPIPDFRDDEIHYGHFFSFSVGCLYAWSEVKYNDDEIKILKRFASIIDLTFRRYFELQKSEANAREAVKQAALDRVRADIASMRTVSDLDRITPLIWKELTILGVPFIRCGVFIMDETQKLIHTFLSTPEGKAIAAFHLPYDTPGNISKVVDNWRRKTIYVDHWGEEEFIQFADILMKEGTLTSREQYLKTIPHGGFYLHFLPFLQGMLYVGNIEQLNEEHIELIQHVAGAFSTAYARYEDFNRLEVAKQQVENTLTDLKQAQQQLVQSEKMASLGELTAGIAHEIQNPLNFVNNFSDVSNELLDEMKNELEKGNKEDAIAIVDDVKQNLEKILHHGKRADAIVKGMLQHSRTSSGQKEPTDINVLADEYLRLAYHGLRAKDKSFNAKFETDFDNSIGKVNIIPQDIGRVILNLINNAFYAVTEKRKHVSDGPAQEGRPGEQVRRGYEPTVTVTTLKDNGRIEIKVKDNGNGIPQRVLDKIFQPFFTTKPTGQGTGLGLSLAYDIVTKGHGGDLKVITQEGEGSEFIIQLPAN